MKLQIIKLLLCGSIFFIYSCDKNINPPVVEDQEFTIDENSPAGSNVGAVVAFEYDEGQTIRFSVSAGNEEGTFTIDSKSGLIKVADPMLLDYETHPDIILTVVVSDDHKRNPMQTSVTITVHLNDLNEFAPVIENQQFEIAEHPAKNEPIGIIQASDQETHQGLSYTIISGNEDLIVVLDSESGSLTVNDPQAFDYDLHHQIDFNVMVRDIHVDSKTDTAVISVIILLPLNPAEINIIKDKSGGSP